MQKFFNSVMLSVMAAGLVSCAGKYKVNMPVAITPTTVRVIPAEVAEGDQTCRRGLQNELRKRGFSVVEKLPDGAATESLVVRYGDEWKWDLVMYLWSMDVSFTDAKTGVVKGTAHYKNRFWHTFPDPENVTRRMFEAIDKRGGIEQPKGS